MDQNLNSYPGVRKLGGAVLEMPKKEFNNLQALLLYFLITLAQSKEWKANNTKIILVLE